MPMVARLQVPYIRDQAEYLPLILQVSLMLNSIILRVVIAALLYA